MRRGNVLGTDQHVRCHQRISGSFGVVRKRHLCFAAFDLHHYSRIWWSLL